MTGQQAIRAMCFLVLAILVPGAAISPPSEPSSLEGKGVFWRRREAFLAVWERRQTQRQASEASYFARLLDACRTDNARLTYNALLRWLDSAHHGPDAATIEAFLARHPDTELRRQVEALQESIMGRATDWNGAVLADALRRVRRKQGHRNTTTVEARLPALNPPWVGILLVVALFPAHGGRPAEAGTAVANPTYVGGQACIACHSREAELWKGSDHALAMQPANSTTVLGNFDNATFEKDGVTSTFFKRDGEYFVRTDGPDGQLHEYNIAYTFGVNPLQQYLIAIPNGRYQALSIAWDSRPATAGGQQWFHLYPHEKIDHRDILHWTGQLQNWNFMCADCHSTNVQKNYHMAEDRYETTWSDINVSCEACHGPGSHHVEWARDAPNGRPSPDPTRGLVVSLKDTSRGTWTFPPGEAIARRTKPLSSRVELETCGRCHARRAQVGGDDQPGHPLADAYRVALLDEGLYHADGQIHDEVYEYGSFLQSKMHQAGVTCSNCHDSHSGRLRAQGNALCAQCHLPATYNGPQHHFHQSDTAGAQCISCHMRERFYMVIDGRRDHSFRVPRPDLSVKIGAPNPCTDCHAGRTPQWAADAVAQWYGPNRRSGWHYGEAIDAGRHARAKAEPLLAQTVEDTTLPNIVRATALSLLPQYLGPQSVRAVETSVRDNDPLVRRAAAATLSVIEPRARLSLGVPLLGDPIRTVRLEAVSALVDVPRNLYTPDQLATLNQVIAEYRQAQAFNADRAEAHVNLGSLEARLGNAQAAEAEYRIALRLQPSFIPAYINLADLYRQQGHEDSVRQTLREALQVDPENGAVHHALGLSLVRQQRLRDAIPELAKAAQLRPDLSRYAYVYGVALHETGQMQRALQVLTEAQARHPGDRDILVALVEYSRQAGDRQGALAWAHKLLEMSPGDLRARRLLESLQRQP
jgi:cytochrome c-type biogenesis protein CcmH/NrfG